MKTATITISLLILTAVLLMGVSPATAKTIKPLIKIDRPVIYADKAETVYVVVQFDIPKPQIDKRHQSDLNIGLVLDRSGSMEEKGKMSYAKQAASFVVDQMAYRDYLSIVEYDDQISVLWPSARVENKRIIKSRINELFPRGSTNLTGGMMSGVDEVLSSYQRRGINRVLLLSDGLANQGITDPREIKRLVKKAKEKGISISTMGLGLNYNEDLMQLIAEYGGGNYYYIEHPRQMNSIFEQEIGTLFATVYKDMKAKVRTSRYVRDCKVFGYINDRDGSTTSFDIGNIYSGEKLSVVCRLELEPGSQGQVDLGYMEFEYFDMEDNSSKSYRSELKVKTSYDARSIELARNKEASAEAILVEADDFHDTQVRLFEEGKPEEAIKNIKTYAATVGVMNQSLDNVLVEKKLEALSMEADRIEMADKDQEYRQSYLKSSKANAYQAKKGKRGMYLQQVGDSGLEVKNLQTALKDKGYYTGSIDGNFSEELKKSVMKFQEDNRISVDGIAGPKTLQALGLY